MMSADQIQTNHASIKINRIDYRLITTLHDMPTLMDNFEKCFSNHIKRDHIDKILYIVFRILHIPNVFRERYVETMNREYTYYTCGLTHGIMFCNLNAEIIYDVILHLLCLLEINYVKERSQSNFNKSMRQYSNLTFAPLIFKLIDIRRYIGIVELPIKFNQKRPKSRIWSNLYIDHTNVQNNLQSKIRNSSIGFPNAVNVYDIIFEGIQRTSTEYIDETFILPHNIGLITPGRYNTINELLIKYNTKKQKAHHDNMRHFTGFTGTEIDYDANILQFAISSAKLKCNAIPALSQEHTLFLRSLRYSNSDNIDISIVLFRSNKRTYSVRLEEIIWSIKQLITDSNRHKHCDIFCVTSQLNNKVFMKCNSHNMTNILPLRNKSINDGQYNTIGIGEIFPNSSEFSNVSLKDLFNINIILDYPWINPNTLNEDKCLKVPLSFKTLIDTFIRLSLNRTNIKNIIGLQNKLHKYFKKLLKEIIFSLKNNAENINVRQLDVGHPESKYSESELEHKVELETLLEEKCDDIEEKNRQKYIIKKFVDLLYKLSMDYYIAYENLLLCLLKDHKIVRMCPTFNCLEMHLLIRNRISCGKCGTIGCAHCNKNHDPDETECQLIDVLTSEHGELSEIEYYRYYNKTICCPSCRTLIIKDKTGSTDCDHITCTCGAHICFGCSKITSSNPLGTHLISYQNRTTNRHSWYCNCIDTKLILPKDHYFDKHIRSSEYVRWNCNSPENCIYCNSDIDIDTPHYLNGQIKSECQIELEKHFKAEYDNTNLANIIHSNNMSEFLVDLDCLLNKRLAENNAINVSEFNDSNVVNEPIEVIVPDIPENIIDNTVDNTVDNTMDNTIDNNIINDENIARMLQEQFWNN